MDTFNIWVVLRSMSTDLQLFQYVHVSNIHTNIQTHILTNIHNLFGLKHIVIKIKLLLYNSRN